MATVPDPVLDARDEAEVAAEMVGSLPPELSDRSDSNPAVAIIEQNAAIYGKLQFQLNRWPRAVITKTLALNQIEIEAAQPATVSQSFTLTNPLAVDTTIPLGTQVSTSDGSIVFETLADLAIAAYTAPAGTVATTIGLTTVTGTGTAFVTGTTWVGWKIQIPSVTGPWYTIASVTNGTSLEITAAAPSTLSLQAWYVGPVTGAVQAEATTGGADTNVGAAKLTTLGGSINGVASTTNGAAATGGTDAETVDEANARAAEEYAARDVCCTETDFAVHAARALGNGGRATARMNTNVSTTSNGVVSLALLAPGWTSSLAVTATERGAAVRDIAQRMGAGATLIDLAANLYAPTCAAVIYRKASHDSSTVRANVGAALNTYLSPNTYQWGRQMYQADLAQIVENTEGVDRLHTLRGVALVGTTYDQAPAAITFTNGSDVATTGTTTGFVANQSVIIDATYNRAYLVIAVTGGVSVQLDRNYQDANNAQTPYRFLATDDNMGGATDIDRWYTLPYSNLNATAASPPASIIVLGGV